MASVPVEVAPDIIQTEEHAAPQIISTLGADKHTSAGIMAGVDTPVVMVAGAVEEKAEKAFTIILPLAETVAVASLTTILVDQAVVEVTMHQPVERLLVPIHLREVRDMDTHLDWAAVVAVQPQLALRLIQVLVPEMAVKGIHLRSLILT